MTGLVWTVITATAMTGLAAALLGWHLTPKTTAQTTGGNR